MIRVTGTLTCFRTGQAEIDRTPKPEHIRLSRKEPGCPSLVVAPRAGPLIRPLDETFADHAA